jgi:hypothetical protein
MPRFVVRVSSSKMPRTVKAPYSHMALIEMKPDWIERLDANGTAYPLMISARAKGVLQIIYKSPPLHARGMNCAAVLLERRMRRVCEIMNRAELSATIMAQEGRLKEWFHELLEEQEEEH